MVYLSGCLHVKYDQIINKDCSDLSYEVMQVFLRGEATQGIDDGADLPKNNKKKERKCRK